jgi:hypothetical protein
MPLMSTLALHWLFPSGSTAKLFFVQFVARRSDNHKTSPDSRELLKA